MRSHDTVTVGRLATLVHESVFVGEGPPPHILLRDYARGVVERAIHLGPEFTAAARLFRPSIAAYGRTSPPKTSFGCHTSVRRPDVGMVRS